MAIKNHQEEQRLYGEYIYPHLHWFIPEKADVLEVGCAEGGLLEVFQSHGHNVVGVEISRDRANKARVDVIGIDICGYNTDERFDLIVMVDVIEHIILKIATLKKVFELLKPGGYLYITFPPKHSPFAGHQQHNKWLKYILWISLLPESIIRLLGSTDAIIENKRKAISVEAFEKMIKDFQVIEKDLYFIRPQYKIRYGWKPRKAWFKYLTFGAEYLLTRWG